MGIAPLVVFGCACVTVGALPHIEGDVAVGIGLFDVVLADRDADAGDGVTAARLEGLAEGVFELQQVEIDCKT